MEWSGSCEEVGRTCDITHINAPYDPVVKSLPAPKLGDYVTVIDETDGELFLDAFPAESADLVTEP